MTEHAKLTPEQIAAIRERLEAATPGPWFTVGLPWTPDEYTNTWITTGVGGDPRGGRCGGVVPVEGGGGVTRYQVGDLTGFKDDDPWFDAEDAAINAAHEMDESVTWERPIGVWRQVGEDMELVYIVHLGTLWKPA